MYLVTILGVETDRESSFSTESEDDFLFTPATSRPAELIVDDGMADGMAGETLKVGNASFGTNNVVGIGTEGGTAAVDKERLAAAWLFGVDAWAAG